MFIFHNTVLIIIPNFWPSVYMYIVNNYILYYNYIVTKKTLFPL